MARTPKRQADRLLGSANSHIDTVLVRAKFLPPALEVGDLDEACDLARAAAEAAMSAASDFHTLFAQLAAMRVAAYEAGR